MNLAVFPEIALAIFLLVFAAVSLRAISRRRDAELAHTAAIPLADDAPAPAGEGGNA
jgi:hypothetical protein